MTNPNNKIIIKDITSKITNSREEFLKNSKIRKPFIFKGYKTEEDRIKDVVYNNRLLYNLPDYPDTQHLKKEKTPDPSDNIIYNFNLNLPRGSKTINPYDTYNKEVTENNSNSNILKEKNNENNYNNTNNNFSKFKYNCSSLRRISTIEKNKYNDLIKKNLIYQPQMRFTARTDLERVFDNLNLISLNEKDRRIIEKQLTNIDLYKYKKPQELLNIQNNNQVEDENKLEEKKYKILPNPIIEDHKKESEKAKNERLLYGKKKLYFEPKNNNNKLWARKENLNNEAKKILSSYHYKTHFKAAEEAQFNIKKKAQSMDKELNTYLMIPNIFHTENNELYSKKKKKLKINKNKYSFNLDYNVLDKTKDIFNFGQDLYKDDEEEIYYKDYNQLSKIYNNNPMFENSNKIKTNVDSLKSLSLLAFKNNEKTLVTENEEKTEEDDDQSINLINNRYNWGNKNSNLVDDVNIHNTAKTILGECNIYSSKSKFNNSFLKSRAGKTMITKGLSINEFLKKHSLNE